MKLKALLIIPILLSLVAMDLVAAQTRPTQKNTTSSQEPGSSDREIGKSYTALRPKQQRLVDDFVRRYNQVTGSELVPEQAYDKRKTISANHV